MRTFRTLIVVLGLVAVGGMSLGCRTTEGFGEDLEAGGRKISNSAREHQN